MTDHCTGELKQGNGNIMQHVRYSAIGMSVCIYWVDSESLIIALSDKIYSGLQIAILEDEIEEQESSPIIIMSQAQGGPVISAISSGKTFLEALL